MPPNAQESALLIAFRSREVAKSPPATPRRYKPTIDAASGSECLASTSEVLSDNAAVELSELSQRLRELNAPTRPRRARQKGPDVGMSDRRLLDCTF